MVDGCVKSSISYLKSVLHSSRGEKTTEHKKTHPGSKSCVSGSSRLQLDKGLKFLTPKNGLLLKATNYLRFHIWNWRVTDTYSMKLTVAIILSTQDPRVVGIIFILKSALKVAGYSYYCDGHLDVFQRINQRLVQSPKSLQTGGRKAKLRVQNVRNICD